MNIFSSMRHAIMRCVSKDNRKKALMLASVTIVACGLLVGCPEPSSTGSGDGSQLAITAVLSRTSVATGATATVTVTATNNGTTASAATTATLYRSTDTTIDTGDTVVGTAKAIPSIAVGTTRTVEFIIPADMTREVSTLNYGACIGSGGTARCSSALTLEVTAAASPDLSVAGVRPTLSTPSYGANTSATISIVVTNSGSVDSGAVTVKFYRQKGGTPDSSADGDAIATDTITSISSTSGSNTATATATFNVGADEGLATYYAIVETRGDAIATNNTSAPTLPVAITAAVSDLVITAFESTPARTTFAASDTFTANITVQNVGGANAVATSISLALVDNAGAVVKELKTIPVDALGAGASNATLSADINLTDTAEGAYRLRATVAAVANEVNTANNAFFLGGGTPRDIIITAETAPDLDISGIIPTLTPAATNSSYSMGSSITLRVDVTNRGNVASTGGTVTFYRQEGGTPAPATDTVVGTAQTLSGIATGATEPAMVTFTTGVAGTAIRYYAVISTVTGETNSNNNTSALTAPIAITAPAPDLDISGVRTELTAASYTVNTTATIRVNVSNTGTEDSTTGATVSFYRVAGTEIDRAADGAAVATASIPAIAKGEDETVSTTFNVGTTGATAALYYAVITQVSDETNRANNTSMVSTPVAINTHPDLVISAFTTVQSVVAAGGTITANVTVQNNGDLQSATTSVSVELLNMDGSAVSPGGLTLTGGASTISVAAINGRQELMVSGTYTVSTMTPVGTTYRLRATVANVTNESDTTNNTFFLGGNTSPDSFTVSEEEVPDLVISGVPVTFGATDYDLNETARIMVEVRNGGTKDNTDGTVTFYRQTGGSPVPTSDTVVGTAQTLSVITKGGGTATAMTDFAATPVGTATYYAVVSGVTGEDNTGNNTSRTAMLTINPLEPELTLATPAITPAGPDYNSSGMITLNVVVTNSGNINSTDGTVTFYRQGGGSPNPVTDDPVGATHSLGTITAKGGTETATSGAFVIGIGGTVQYYAVVSEVTNEMNTGNNTSDATAGINVTPVPDLTITAINIPNTVISGRSVTATITVRNVGAAASAATTASIEVFNFGGSAYTLADAITVDALMPGENDTTMPTSVNIDVGNANATFNVRARVVPPATGTGETNTGNNEFVLGDETTDYLTVNNLDLTVATPTITPAGPYTEDDMVTLSAVVTNGGTGASLTGSDGGVVRFYRRGTSGAPDLRVGTPYSLSTAIVAGGTVTATSGMFELDVAGTNVQYYAEIRDVTGETKTDNNISGTRDITVNTHPDLEITQFTITGGATSIAAGGTFTANVTVRNNGGTGSAATTVSFALADSANTNTATTTPLTGMISIDAIAGGGNSGSQTGTITVPAGTANGTYFLRATVTAVANESDRDNNIYHFGGTPSQANFVIGGPELTITQFTTSATSAAQGGTFTANIVVRNDGSVQSPQTTVSFALLGGGAAPPLTGTIAVPAITAGTSTNSLSGTITVPVTINTGSYRIFATVASVTDETNTANNEFFLGGTASHVTFTITAIRGATFNLGSDCAVFIGPSDLDCNAARTTDLTTNEVIGTVVSTGATGFALANTISNPMFVIHPTSGVVTANRGVAISDIPTTFDITVTDGAGAGTQRVRITNTAGTKDDVTAQVGAPVANSVTLFTPATSTGRTYACRGEHGGCITSTAAASAFTFGWHAPYSSGTTGTGFDASGYERVYVEYQIDRPAISPAPPIQFTLRLGYAYFSFGTSATDMAERLQADTGNWETASIPLTRSPFGIFSSDDVSNVGIYDQGKDVDVSIRAIYFR